MLVGGYRFSHKPGRNKTAQDVTADLDRAGVKLDVDTVRKWIREAIEFLPPEE